MNRAQGKLLSVLSATALLTAVARSGQQNKSSETSVCTRIVDLETSVGLACSAELKARLNPELNPHKLVLFRII